MSRKKALYSHEVTIHSLYKSCAKLDLERSAPDPRIAYGKLSLMSEQQKSHDDKSDTPSVTGGIIVALLLGVAGYFTGGKFGVFVGLCFAYVIWLSVDPPWLNRKK